MKPTPTQAEQIAEYLGALNAMVAGHPHYQGATAPQVPTYDADYSGRRFVRVVRTVYASRSVEAFLDTASESLDVLKPGGWKGPQTGKGGLAVRGSLSTPAAREVLFADLDPYGGYLYTERYEARQAVAVVAEAERITEGAAA